MTSKLDYLQKYLAQPGEQASAGGAAKEKKRKRKAVAEPNTLLIRDLSEVLPASKETKKKSSVAVTYGEEEPEAVFVDEDLVAEAQKVEFETSGVRWKISQHRQAQQPHFRKPRTSSTLQSSTGRRTVKKDSGGDLSLPRGAPRRSRSASDISPPRGVAHTAKQELDDDLSPPRGGDAQVKREPHSDDELVVKPGRQRPPQRRSADSDDDVSPPRSAARPAVRCSASGGTGTRQVKREQDSDDDLSPPRLGSGVAKGSTHARQCANGAASQLAPAARHDSDSDLSVPRAATPSRSVAPARQRHDSDGSDLSPPRRGSPTGAAAARKRRDSDEDLSPPRRGASLAKNRDAGEERMSSGLRAGLVRGSDLKEEAAQIRADRRAAIEAAPSVETGKGAETVYRNRQGQRIGREEWVEQQQKKRKKRLSEYPEQELEWGGGLKQQYSKEEEMAELSRIAAQPFARYEPDEKYMQELRGKQDWNDPLRKFQDQAGAVGETQKEAAAKPKCPFPPWPNRFGILPGYRWDGKVRGNNHEKRWLEARNTRECKKREQWQNELDEM